MLILMVVPKKINADAELENWGGHFQSVVFGVKKYSAMAAAMPVLASLTPAGVDVLILDENIETLDFDVKADLVAVTSNTTTVERAYQITDEFRRRGIRTILGGIHVSMLPDEALGHADAVLVGEAEKTWPQAVADAKRNELKRVYSSSELPDLESQPLPRYDLVKNKMYNFHLVQTTRGCPYDCEFCSVKSYLGRQYRCKSVEKVVREVEFLNSIDKKLILFSDDNFTANRERTKKLLRALTPLKISYTMQATVDIYKDRELLELLLESGCLSVFIGFESLDQRNLTASRKSQQYRVEIYKEAIATIQNFGFVILGSFMFGFDQDSTGVFQDTVDFVEDANLGNCVVNIATPYPGTDFYERIRREGRLLTMPWTQFDISHVCFKPARMSAHELREGYMWAFQQIFDLDKIWKRMMHLYGVWGPDRAKMRERFFPLLTNLNSHFVSMSYPAVRLPRRIA